MHGDDKFWNSFLSCYSNYEQKLTNYHEKGYNESIILYVKQISATDKHNNEFLTNT